MDTTDALCPCGSDASFSACCGRYLSGADRPETAEALMRSRFSAFVRGAAAYLVATRHPDARAPAEGEDIARSIAETEWLSLAVLRTEAGGAEDASGEVEFAAAFRRRGGVLAAGGGKPQQMHERSRFVRRGGVWYYTEGDRLPPWKPKRGAPCWCGSGRKFKACCGRPSPS